jgi:hypothetical protein
MNALRRRLRKCVKKRGVSVKCSRRSRSFGFVLVALWGNDSTPSVLKRYETGTILCAYGLDGTVPLVRWVSSTRETV